MTDARPGEMPAEDAPSAPAGDARDAVIRLILGRRSIRSGFSAEPLDEDDLAQVIACGLAAPSSKNSMPWRLHVVTDRVTLAWIADQVVAQSKRDAYVPHDPATGGPRPEYRSTVVDSAEVLRSVPAAVFIENLGPFSRGLEQLVDTPPERLRPSLFGYALEMVGIGACMENMWLAAASLGLSSAFLGDVVIAEQAIAERLGTTGELLGALTVGRSPDRPVPPMDRPSLVDTPRARWHRPAP